MRNHLASLAALVVTAATAAAQSERATIWSNAVRDAIDSGWVVTTPTGSSDYLSVAYAVVATRNVEGATVSSALQVKGIAISTADFGTAQTYPTVGVFRPNVTLDPGGSTPDLTLPIAISTEAYAGGLPLFAYQDFDAIAPGTIPTGDATTLAVVQLPPGDSGLLAVGADGNTGAPGTSGFTQDGYATPAVTLTSLDFGLAIGQDNSTTSSCKAAERAPHGRLRCQKLTAAGIMAGDRLTTSVASDDTLALAFFGNKPGDRWRLYYNTTPCSPAVPLGPVLTTIADGDGSGSFFRISSTFPGGFGGQTFRFSAVWGNGSCLAPGAGFTNCVTVITAPDCGCGGMIDDCTMESGWSVNVPALSSDYFNNSFGPKPPSVNGVTGLTIAVMDFVTAVPAYPTAGVSTANTTVDPAGCTPHVVGTGVLAKVSPFTFTSGTFATTCSQFVSQVVSVPGSAMTGPSIHGWVQFPPGDPGLLGVGADTSSGTSGKSFFSMDAYTTPAVSFFTNWGIHLRTN